MQGGVSLVVFLLVCEAYFLNQLLFFKGQLPLSKSKYFHKHTEMQTKTASTQTVSKPKHFAI